MMRIIYFAVTILALLSCQSPKIEIIDADKLKSLQESGINVVDVRTSAEYDNGHLPGVKTNIDFFANDFLEKMEGLDKDQPIIIHCKKGGRSAKAAQLLVTNGFVRVYDYAGGYSDWVNRGENIEQ